VILSRDLRDALVNLGRIEPYRRTYAKRLPKAPELLGEIEVNLAPVARGVRERDGTRQKQVQATVDALIFVAAKNHRQRNWLALLGDSGRRTVLTSISASSALRHRNAWLQP